MNKYERNIGLTALSIVIACSLVYWEAATTSRTNVIGGILLLVLVFVGVLALQAHRYGRTFYYDNRTFGYAGLQDGQYQTLYERWVRKGGDDYYIALVFDLNRRLPWTVLLHERPEFPMFSMVVGNPYKLDARKVRQELHL